LSCRLKLEVESADPRDSGREFQTVGPVTQKTLSRTFKIHLRSHPRWRTAPNFSLQTAITQPLIVHISYGVWSRDSRFISSVQGQKVKGQGHNMT